MKPSDDPKANELRNSNINQKDGDSPSVDGDEVENQNGYSLSGDDYAEQTSALDDFDRQLDELEKELSS